MHWKKYLPSKVPTAIYEYAKKGDAIFLRPESQNIKMVTLQFHLMSNKNILIINNLWNQKNITTERIYISIQTENILNILKGTK